MNPNVIGSVRTQTTIAPGQREWCPHKFFDCTYFFEENGVHIAPCAGSGAPHTQLRQSQGSPLRMLAYLLHLDRGVVPLNDFVDTNIYEIDWADIAPSEGSGGSTRLRPE